MSKSFQRRVSWDQERAGRERDLGAATSTFMERKQKIRSFEIVYSASTRKLRSLCYAKPVQLCFAWTAMPYLLSPACHASSITSWVCLSYNTSPVLSWLAFLSCLSHHAYPVLFYLASPVVPYLYCHALPVLSCLPYSILSCIAPTVPLYFGCPKTKPPFYPVMPSPFCPFTTRSCSFLSYLVCPITPVLVCPFQLFLTLISPF